MKDPFIIDPNFDESNRCEKCYGDGHVHKRPEGKWEGCMAHRVGGRCCDWQNKTCPDCKGTGKAPVKRKAKVLIQVTFANDEESSAQTHMPGFTSDYATFCGIDGNDPQTGQMGIKAAPKGTKLTCPTCVKAWNICREVRPNRVCQNLP
jgi:hypothetical protein